MSTIPKLNIKGGEGDIQALNRWADSVTVAFADQLTKVHAANQKATVVTAAVAALPPPTAPVTDGLIHGDKIWETDSAYVFLRDDFLNNFNTDSFGSTTLTGGLGQLGWSLIGNPLIPSQAGGAPPNIGQLSWDNPSLVSYYGVLLLNAIGMSVSAGMFTNGMALLENPPWKMTWVFKVDHPTNSANGFSFTQKSLYIGLSGTCGEYANGISTARPPVFIGLRYDTSTSTPSINDSFFTFEVVTNRQYVSSTPRNNTQGLTFVTNVAPVAGVWHRLDIQCTIAGTVTLTLDGSTTNTATFVVPTVSITSSTSGQASRTNGSARVYNSIGSSGTNSAMVAGTGSKVTVSGLTGLNAPLNGTWIPMYIDSATMYFDAPGTDIGNNSTAFTAVSLPAITPVCSFGNDDTASPAQATARVIVDFFSLIWNPGVGGGTGTPDSTKARYW